MLRSILNKLRPDAGSQGPVLHAGAFGKHPAWDDHIPDIGLETDRLVEVKRILYLQGIGRNIDSGAWEELGAERSLEGFQHLFLNYEGQSWVAGRIWSSTDGKGRSRYPMIVCVQCNDRDFGGLREATCEQLGLAEQQCVQTQSAAVVTSIVGKVRDDLRRLIAESGDAEQQADPVSVEDPLAVLASRPEMGADHDGLIRVLYQIDREMAEYRVPNSRALGITRTNQAIGRPHHIRVPRCADSAPEALVLWSSFLKSQFPGKVPLWVICPESGSGQWADLMVGPPTEREFFCVRVPSSELPLTTDIPYQIDEEFLDQARAMISKV